MTRPATAHGHHLPLLPTTAFVLVWSSGYIAGPLGVEAVEPLTLVAIRFAVAAAVAAAVARVLRGPVRHAFPGGRHVLPRVALVGFTMNGLQFALAYLGFAAGLEPTLASLLHSLSPVLTAILAGLLMHERLSPLQVGGFVLGVVGVLLVLGPDVDGAGGAVGLACGLLSMLALTLGTLGQRWIGHGADPWWSATVQFAVSAPPVALAALLLEGTDTVHDPWAALGALAWLALVNSIVGLLLLGVLVRSGGAGSSASVFFLMPPVTAVLAYLFFGDVLGPLELTGLVVAVLGVAAATRTGRLRVEPTEPVG